MWADALSKEVYRKRLAQVQRKAVLRVNSAYRTVSEPYVLVNAGVNPIALLAKERKAVYERKAEVGNKIARQEERERTLRIWQTSWHDDTRGRWTAKLIRKVKPWIDRSHGEVDYYLTQFLSGHGYFRRYLHGIGRARTPYCLYCPEMPDDAEYTFFKCVRWAQHSVELEGGTEEVTPDNIVELMLSGEKNWISVAHWVQNILRTKKTDLDQAYHREI